jgi:ketosteroid isomerase-like protein
MKIFAFCFSCVFLYILPLSAQNAASKATNTILQLMKAQETAWNKGDLEGFMEAYWRSDSLKFIGKNGITYGWQATLDNYRKSYANPAQMGQLRFDILHTELSGKQAFVIGRWHLQREAYPSLQGYFTLFWKKIKGQWRIVADHSS